MEKRDITKARKKFLFYFSKGFYSQKYIDWERDYKFQAHLQWNEKLPRAKFRKMIDNGEFTLAAKTAVSIESKTNLLFSFEKMALRDAINSPGGSEAFSRGLYEFLHGKAAMPKRFDRWCEIVASLPRKQTRVLTWPLVTVFGFLAQPSEHFFVKPLVTRRAAEKLNYDLHYSSKPSYANYHGFLELAARLEDAISDMKPRDMIDLQSFLWVQGSEEYPD